MNSAEIIEEIQNLVKGEKVQNEDILNLLQCHNCDHLILKSSNLEYEQKISLHRTINSIETLERYKSCKAIFEQKNFPYAIIKGAVLSKALYGDATLRRSGDIDILISRTNIDFVKKFLNSIGFFQGRVVDGKFNPSTRQEIIFQTALTHQITPFVKKTNNPLCPYVYLDINTSIIWGESDNEIDMDYVLSFVDKSTLFDYTFYKLCPEMEFISLCLHHYKDMNSLYLLVSGSLKFGLYYDIYMYLHNIPMRKNVLKDICEKLNVGKYIYFCVYQLQEIFCDTTIEKYERMLFRYKEDVLLDTYGLNETERKVWNIGLIDRLFNVNISEYIRTQLSDKELKKVEINRKLM